MNPTIRPIQYDDLPALTQFCADFPGEKRQKEIWLKRFLWWWEENPAFEPCFPRGVVLEHHNSFHGMFALIPTRIRYNGKQCIAANMSCWRVLPEYRNLSLGMMVKIVALANAYPIFNTTPTPQVEKILQRVPFHSFGDRITTESFLIAPSDNDYFPTREMRRYQIIKNLLSRSGTVDPPDRHLYGKALLNTIRRSSRLRQIMLTAGHCEEKTDFGQEFEPLWEKTHALYETTNVRSSHALAWYIKTNPNRSDKLHLLTHEKEGQLTAFGIFKHQHNNHWPDQEHLITLDLWSAPPTEENLLPLLGFALEFARKRNISVIRIPHFHKSIAALCQNFELTLPLAKPMTCYHLPPQGEPPASLERFYPSRNMGDYGC